MYLAMKTVCLKFVVIALLISSPLAQSCKLFISTGLAYGFWLDYQEEIVFNFSIGYRRIGKNLYFDVYPTLFYNPKSRGLPIFPWIGFTIGWFI